MTVAIPKSVVLPNDPWERVHVDYGELNNHYFLVLVDAFKITINVLRDTFYTYGFPQILVSDSGLQLHNLHQPSYRIFFVVTTSFIISHHDITLLQTALLRAW